MEATEDLVGLMAGMDVCCISDALDALGMSGAAIGPVPVWEGARVVGRAQTVRLAEGPPPPGSPPVHLGARAIEACAPGDVIVVDNAGRTGMGAWGGLLSLAASLRRVAGVIVDGACRDVDEAREMSFPVFARAGVQRTARARVHEDSNGESVQIAGVDVHPGDLVMADGSGVVVLAADRAADVVHRAREIQLRELQMQERLRAGDAVSDVLGGSYEGMLSGR